MYCGEKKWQITQKDNINKQIFSNDLHNELMNVNITVDE